MSKRNKMIVLVSLIAAIAVGFVMLRQRPGMSNEELIALSKSDPAAFDAYVQSRINAHQSILEAQRRAQVDTPKNKPMTPEELIELSKTDPQALTKFLNSHVQEEHNEVDKLLNFLAHGKYE